MDKNSRNYIEYMNKVGKNRKDTPISTPYLVFKEKTKNDVNYLYNIANEHVKNYRYNKNDKGISGIENQSRNISQGLCLSQDYSINTQNQENKGIQKILSYSHSTGDVFINGRNMEITNPQYFYKRNNEDYLKYRIEQKKYLDYNFNIMMKKFQNKYKKEPIINPYNPIKSNLEQSKSDLEHNPILNPVNYYGYNKYLRKDLEKDKFGKYGNSIIMNNNNF